MSDPRAIVASRAREYAEARHRLKESIYKAKTAGVPLAQIARDASIDRSTVYKWIEEIEKTTSGEAQYRLVDALDEALGVMVGLVSEVNRQTLLTRIKSSEIEHKMLGIEIGSSSLKAVPSLHLTDDQKQAIHVGQQAYAVAKRIRDKGGSYPEFVTV